MKRKKSQNVVFILSLNVTFFILAIMINSRAFIFGISLSIAVMLFYLDIIALKKKNLIVLTGVILIFLSILIFQFKTDSSSGRILIYKISLGMLKNNWFKGIGIGKFPYQYRENQAKYFEYSNYSQKELLLADNAKNAYNDYLQFIIETGILGALTLIIISILIFLLIYKSLRNNNKPLYLLISCCMLISISGAGIVTHVFEKWYFQSLFILSLIIIFYYGFKVNKFIIVLSLCLSLFGISYIHFGNYWKNSYYYSLYNEGKYLYKSGYKLQSLKIYNKIYPYLKNNQFFLYDFVTVLDDLNYPIIAEKIAKEMVFIDNGNMFYLKLADCYYKNHKYNLAEKTYITSINMVPNRFNTRYKLFNFYIQTNQLIKAKVVGIKILTLPIKIPSLAIDQIRTHVDKTLKKWNKKH